ncbi:MAG: DUF1697 domain-containing protein [Anaerolineae bacterium]|nr:DUF1697 domain-containing protein [Phycisphaerae bacterium]
MANPSSNASPTHVALLRGINVGGKNMLPMKDLAKFCTGAGCTAVQTYIQSGNVMFRADAACAKQMPAAVEAMIEKRFGFRPPVVVRTAKELRQVVNSNPFFQDGPDTTPLFVGFLSSRPTARAVATLDSNRSPGDAYRVVGREIYMNLGNGAARMKLTTAYFDLKLSATSTFRNWRTVLALVEMLSPQR